MKDKYEEIKKNIATDMKNIESMQKNQEMKVKYLGKKGLITELTSNMKDLSNDEKREVGGYVSELRMLFNDLFEKEKERLEAIDLNNRLNDEKIDITLSSTNIPIGSPSPIEKLTEELEDLLMSMGYDVVEGPELEKDLYNFELLNLPIGHPARDAQDTFYTYKEELLLRSQTSPVQIRTMLAQEEKGPLRIICPGKTYRRDDDDASHSHQFTQLEGLLIDKDISLAHLKGTFDVIAKQLFGNTRQTRFRPSYYPFTEPSVEVDISCFNCDSKGCNVCKNTGWITVGGAGMVNPTVLENGGYDSTEWTGFAFGFGLDRLTMLKYNINDIRTLYHTDLRVVEIFDRKEKDEYGN